MGQISDFMTTDHTHCDHLFAEAENAVAGSDWEIGQARFESFQSATLHHFAREESLLFPAFEAKTGIVHGPTAIMRNEHEEMREALCGMQLALGRHDADSFLGLAETLLMLMRQHNMKEEQILYPMADQALREVAGEMVSRMESMPV
jgi:hemerythrin-like domain-containing protein